jgi:hypothetical protein
LPLQVTMAQLDCCDSGMLAGLWSDLLPLATTSIVAGGASGQDGLDCIAP